MLFDPTSIKILLAEDDLPNGALLRRRIESEGYNVLMANNGSDAVDIARRVLPDLILLDVMMPVMDGLEACKLLKADNATRDIPVVFFSARDDIDLKAKGLALGAYDYLTKPFTAKEIIARINIILRSHHAIKVSKQNGGLPKDTRILQTNDPYRLTGNFLNGRYELIKYAGGGGMGAVYYALDIERQEIVAVKILKPDIIARNPEYIELFDKEMKAAQQLSHPHIVKVFDRGTDNAIAFMVMEWLEGVSLEELLIQSLLPLNRIINIFEQICSAITFAHENKVIHLDIKPANILFIKNNQPGDFIKVIDFGLSRIISKESEITVTRFRGTHQYCAPEQFGGKVSRRSDIYSLGATLYHLMSGVIPFSTSYINAKIHPNLELPELSSLTNYRSDISNKLDNVISKALNKDPRKRQESAKQLFDEFSAAVYFTNFTTNIKNRNPEEDQAL